LTAIADIFDALTSYRPYKTAWNVDRAMQEIDAQCGHALDPTLGAAFIGLRPDLERVIAAYPDSANLH
jgi:putative two-component system response regulator